MPSQYKHEDIVRVKEDLSQLTPKQQEAVPDIEEFWEQGVRTFSEMGELGEFSYDHYRRVFRRVFGPADGFNQGSFEDINQKYGSFAEYKRLREEGMIADGKEIFRGGAMMDGDLLDDPEKMQIAKIFFEFGYSKGREDEQRNARAIGGDDS